VAGLQRLSRGPVILVTVLCERRRVVSISGLMQEQMGRDLMPHKRELRRHQRGFVNLKAGAGGSWSVAFGHSDIAQGVARKSED